MQFLIGLFIGAAVVGGLWFWSKNKAKALASDAEVKKVV
jgi:hypothetical protein